MAAPRHQAAKPSKAAIAAFDAHAGMIGDGLLREDEAEGLAGALPQLAKLADRMGVLQRPVIEWSKEEMMRFLAMAVRAAVPLISISHHDPDFNDRMPF